MILYKLKFHFLFILFFLTVSNSLGQDAHFSQFYANPLYLNPAFAGTEICPRFTFNFRDQWPVIPNNFLAFSASYDQHINALHGGIGVLVSADIEGGGLYQAYNAGAIYNFSVRISKQFYLQFALQAGYLHKAFNRNLLFASELSPDPVPETLPEDHATKSDFDANFGFVGYSPYLYFGVAAHHLIPPKQKGFFTSLTDTAKTKPKITAHIGGKIPIVQKVKNEETFGDIYIYPNVVFISQGKFHYLHEGFYIKFHPLTIGASLRHNFENLDAFIISCGLEYKFFRIGYSYDFNLTKLEGTGGAHEVSLQFIIPCSYEQKSKKVQKKGRAYIPVSCPKF